METSKENFSASTGLEGLKCKHTSKVYLEEFTCLKLDAKYNMVVCKAGESREIFTSQGKIKLKIIPVLYLEAPSPNSSPYLFILLFGFLYKT